MRPTALVNELSPRSDLIRAISRVDGGEFFERNGILFLSLDEVRRDTADMISAQPFLGTLAADPTLRGVLRTLSQSLEGVRVGKAKLDDLRPALAAIADALEALANGKPAAFSWRTLIAGRAGKTVGASSFREHPTGLGFQRSAARTQGNCGDTGSDFQAWAHARKRRKGASHRIRRPVGRGIRHDRGRRGLEQRRDVASCRLRVVARVEEGTHHSGCLRQSHCRTGYYGRYRPMDGKELNPISVAFAVLFVGLGVDFSIQFSVRYRSERSCGR